MDKLFSNQSNPYTTNIFETLIGALNMAPIKVSAQYKIVVALDGNLYLDDYTGRRVIINLDNEFLPQVSSFLKVSTNITETDILKYGGYQRSTNKYFHIPMYIGSDKTKYPNYFVLTKSLNETIDNSDFLYQFGSILQLVNLKSIGIHKIFDEINNEPYFDYPLYFDWNEGFLKIFGYGINQDSPVVNTMDLTKIRANQPYLDVFNNKILNMYSNNGMFFPRFLNIEFEFDYSNDYKHFNNFYGYLSLAEEFTSYDFENPLNSNLFENKLYVKVRENNKVREELINNWKQVSHKDKVTVDNYKIIQSRASVQEISNQAAQYRLKLYKIDVNETFRIYHPNGDLEFEYIVNQSKIISTSLYQTLINICRDATLLSNRKFIFSVTQSDNKKYCVIKIVWNNIDKFDEEFTIEFPNHCTVFDRFITEPNYKKFRGIKETDLWLRNDSVVLYSGKTISLNNQEYTITERFKFNDQTILRLDKSHDIERIQECIVYDNKVEKILQLNPIPFLNLNSNLKSYLPYEQNLYVDELTEKFVTNADGDVIIDGQLHKLSDIAQKAIDNFKTRDDKALNQYVTEINGELDDIDYIDNTDSNKTNILNMMFCSTGHTAYLTPQILNIDKHFYLQNGCLDINQLNSDSLKFNWFLIKSITPKYLENDIRSLRYFTSKPNLTSKLIKVSDNICETIFLGVKYQLPVKFANYDFAVYLNPNNELELKLNYKFELDNLNKKLYLVINKYLDFIDLIRGGNPNEQPLIDLSFLHNTIHSHNTNSQILENFKVGGLIICPDDISEYYLETGGNGIANNWYHNFKVNPDNDPTILPDYKIAVFRDLIAGGTINNFNDFFRLNSDSTLYIYSTIEYNNTKYTYISMIIDIKNISYINMDYLWCDDIKIRFFDTQTIFLKKFNLEKEIEEILYVDKNDIHDLVATSTTGIYSEYVKIGTLISNNTQKFELLLPDKELSLKEEYFEIDVNIFENPNNIIYGTTEKYAVKTLFKFPEFGYSNFSDNEFIDKFILDPIDTTQNSYKITLFNRNQIWKVIKDLIRIDLKFKEMLESQVKAILNDLMITNLVDYTEINAVPIKNSDEFINFGVIDIDRNIAIWNILGDKKVSTFNRYSAPYFPYFQLFPNEIKFQLIDNPKTIFNIYDLNFGGPDISATGLWKEIQGNIVSSLFCKSNDIELILPLNNDSETNKQINIKENLSKFINIEECIINNRNETYIKKIDMNIDSYIIEKYTNYLLENFYVFDSIYDNSTNKRLKYSIDKKNKYVLNITVDQNYLVDQVKIIFKRK